MINLSRKKLLTPFLICMGATLVMPALYPEMRIFYLSPFIVMTLYRLPHLKILITSFILGLTLGIFSFDSRLGLMGLALVLTSGLIHPLKQYFFADRFYTLPLLTYLLTALFTLIQAFFFSAFANIESLFEALLTEVIIMPIADALFAFIVFVLPSLFFKALHRYRLFNLENSRDSSVASN